MKGGIELKLASKELVKEVFADIQDLYKDKMSITEFEVRRKLRWPQLPLFKKKEGD